MYNTVYENVLPWLKSCKVKCFSFHFLNMDTYKCLVMVKICEKLKEYTISNIRCQLSGGN